MKYKDIYRIISVVATVIGIVGVFYSDLANAIPLPYAEQVRDVANHIVVALTSLLGTRSLWKLTHSKEGELYDNE